MKLDEAFNIRAHFHWNLSYGFIREIFAFIRESYALITKVTHKYAKVIVFLPTKKSSMGFRNNEIARKKRPKKTYQKKKAKQIKKEPKKKNQNKKTKKQKQNKKSQKNPLQHVT